MKGEKDHRQHKALSNTIEDLMIFLPLKVKEIEILKAQVISSLSRQLTR